MTRLRLGISTCPNDTFAFHGLLTGAVSHRGLDPDVALLDVQELNQGLDRGDFDVAKASFHAALHLADRCAVLPVGSAVGFGVGPVLLAAPPETRRSGRRPRILAPGAWTTATLLYRLFHPGDGVLEQVVFSDIMPALARGDADLGVCIHEGRFTHERDGLLLVEDLGRTWEEATGHPLPLGGLLVRRDLAPELVERVTAVVSDSLAYGLEHPDRTLPTMRRYAQELDDAVIRAHVDLYVNAWTRDLGPEGRAALHELARRARDAGVIPPDAPAPTIAGERP